MRRVCAIVGATLVVCIAALHGYWAIRGTWLTGTTTDGAVNFEESLPLGSRLVTWGLVGVLVSSAVLMLVRAGVLRMRIPSWTTIAGCAFVVFFALIMFGAAVSSIDEADFWNRFVYTPMAVVMLASALVVTFTPRPRDPQAGENKRSN